MKKHLSLLAACLALCLGGGAALAAGDGGSDRKAGKAEKLRIHNAFETAKNRCATLADNARDVCNAEAKAAYDVARAELKARSKPGGKSEARLAAVRARAKMAVANEKCDAMDGSAKEVCRKDAREVFQRDRNDAKLALKDRKDDGKGRAKDGMAGDRKGDDSLAAERNGRGADDLAGDRKGKGDDAMAAESREERKRDREARREARQDRGDRQDRLAAARERCDALAGAARDDCLADAQRRFGSM